jgi:iron(III) transport system ATP-binding protein
MIKLTGLVKRFPGRTVTASAVDGLDLEVPAGSLVALLGPSGCGKTTTLRLIAGLDRPDHGEIVIDDEVVCDPAKGIFVGAHRRPIGIVFQSYAIWPHMTVAQNVAFPLRAGRPRVSRQEVRERAIAALDLVGLADFADRPAPALSGGQQQRVALARALIREPKVLLLDEPLSNLAAGLRDRMRDEIRGMQQRLGITTIFVTHDQDEALAVGDQVAVMSQARIVEKGLPQDIYTWPRTEFTARFLGVSNVMAGTIRSVSPGVAEVAVAAGVLRCRPCAGASDGGQVSVLMRPENFLLSRRPPDGPAWPGTVDLSIYHGDCWDYHVKVAGEVLKVRAYQQKEELRRGDTVFLVPDENAAILLPAPGSRRPGP